MDNIAKYDDFDDEDLKLFSSSKSSKNHTTFEEITGSSERYPVVDTKKPFVCQQCGVSFAREKALISHSRVRRNVLLVFIALNILIGVFVFSVTRW